MDGSEPKLIAIGQFSKMTRLSIKALRLYAENGLLPPAHVDSSTGYRYYRLSQAKDAEVIRILRSVEMPLDDIKSVLAAESEAQALRTLLTHKNRLAEKLATQERMLTYLETIIKQKEIAMPQEIEITEATPQTIAAVRVHTSLAGIKDAIGNSFGKLMPALASSGHMPTGAPMTIYHDLIDQETDGDIEICVPVANSFSGSNDVVGRELEGGEMATSTHRGPYEEIGPVYHALMSWISENGYEIAGPPREVYLNDPTQVSPAEILTRVDFPVCTAKK
jgi:effector-binding domain-containing protein